MSVSPVAQAIASLGGPAAVARLFDPPLAPWAISKWIKFGLPADRVLWLARQTDWEFTPHQLAPNLYPNADDGLPPPALRRPVSSRESAA